MKDRLILQRRMLPCLSGGVARTVALVWCLVLVSVLPAGAAAQWFSEQFESRGAIEAAGGTIAEGVEFRPGQIGEAVFLEGGQTVRLPVPPIGAGAWTVEFREWICWPPAGPGFRCAIPVLSLLRSGAPDAASLIITHNGRAYGYTREIGVHLKLPVAGGGAAFAGMLSADCLSWPDACWQKVSIAWTPGADGAPGVFRLYLNGELHDTIAGAPDVSPEMLFDTAIIGPPGESTRIAVDDLRIFPGSPEISTAPRNLVRNYSFEHDYNMDGVPDFWSQIGDNGKGYWGGPAGISPAERGVNQCTDVDAFSGRRSLRMESLASGVSGQVIVTIFGFEPGREYVLDAAVKTSRPRLSMMLCPYDMDDNLMVEKKTIFTVELPPDNLNRWTLLSESSTSPLLFRAPTGCRYAHLYLLINERQCVYWDDVYCIATGGGADQ